MLRLLRSGKVRDIYEVDADLLFMVTSDRISAFDVVMAEPIPDKGRILTAMSTYWFSALADITPSHLVSADPASYPEGIPDAESIVGRGMLVYKADMLPVEWIVRGYLAGSAWSEYQATATVHGEPLPKGLLHASKLPEPMFTPSTKAVSGHDQNISFEDAVAIVGRSAASRAKEVCLAIYERAAARCLEGGIILADTKFEMGYIRGELALCDEVLTPDSSRLWPQSQWEPGKPVPSFDKQPLRDWLEGTGWGKTPPPPPLPAQVISETHDRYLKAYELITQKKLVDWYGGK
ncbi:MAG: phosphoribosylaminoimidazolesuccinocarboxamide synthase [Actinobacteria bacterium]|jgi:phosphoribosylaminoimidazole-succinocarboxamide synthase|nr:phosphoribosylaminoimidazolesuccinocarboxamide synthase [Actinomycetota bacterium]